MVPTTLIDVIAIVASTTILLGIPILLLLSYRFHRTQTRALAPFIFGDADELVTSVRISYTLVKRQLEHQLTLRKKTQTDLLVGIDFRIAELEKARATYEQIQLKIQKHSKKLLAKSSDPFYLMNRIFIRNNLRQCDRVKAQIDELLHLEQDLRDKIKHIETRTNIT